MGDTGDFSLGRKTEEASREGECIAASWRWTTRCSGQQGGGQAGGRVDTMGRGLCVTGGPSCWMRSRRLWAGFSGLPRVSWGKAYAQITLQGLGPLGCSLRPPCGVRRGPPGNSLSMQLWGPVSRGGRGRPIKSSDPSAPQCLPERSCCFLGYFFKSTCQDVCMLFKNRNVSMLHKLF